MLAESIGKLPPATGGGCGLTPVPPSASPISRRPAHVEGPHDKCSPSSPSIGRPHRRNPWGLEMHDALAYLGGRTMNELFAASATTRIG